MEIWYFLALSVAILMIDIFMIGGVLIGVSAGIALTGAVQWAQGELSWSEILIWCSILSLVCSFVLYKLNVRFRIESSTTEPNSSDRFIGMQATVVSDFTAGAGQVKFEDGQWAARSKYDLKANQVVIIERVDGAVAHVLPLD